MANLFVAGLALGMIAVPPMAGQFEHRVRIDHASGPVDAHYRSTVKVATKQVGTAAGPGKMSTLACTWRADVTVEREARNASGSVMRRSIASDGVIEGRRAGWCSTHRDSIDAEVARHGETLRGHLVEVARDDHKVLNGELDGLPRSTG